MTILLQKILILIHATRLRKHKMDFFRSESGFDDHQIKLVRNYFGESNSKKAGEPYWVFEEPVFRQICPHALRFAPGEDFGGQSQGRKRKICVKAFRNPCPRKERILCEMYGICHGNEGRALRTVLAQGDEEGIRRTGVLIGEVEGKGGHLQGCLIAFHSARIPLLPVFRTGLKAGPEGPMLGAKIPGSSHVFTTLPSLFLNNPVISSILYQIDSKMAIEQLNRRRICRRSSMPIHPLHKPRDPPQTAVDMAGIRS